jgi:hypothetical protein
MTKIAIEKWALWLFITASFLHDIHPGEQIYCITARSID